MFDRREWILGRQTSQLLSLSNRQYVKAADAANAGLSMIEHFVQKQVVGAITSQTNMRISLLYPGNQLSKLILKRCMCTF